MHVRFGDYHVSDIEFVAAFDVDAKKVGRDLSEAIVASGNNSRDQVRAGPADHRVDGVVEGRHGAVSGRSPARHPPPPWKPSGR
jgi:myo-inositol-1-phosphate synthase